jgi:hypothetical protein
MQGWKKGRAAAKASRPFCFAYEQFSSAPEWPGAPKDCAKSSLAGHTKPARRR